MSEWGPIDELRAAVKDWQGEAEKLRREARNLELRAGEIFERSIKLDLLADKLEREAQP